MRKDCRRVFLASLFLAAWIVGGQASALDKTGLVLYFNFDEANAPVITDLSNNGNDGELKGNPEWVEGKYGLGLYLAEVGDFVEVPDSPTLDIEESLTLAIWANVESLPDGSCALFQKPTAYMLHTTTGGVGCKVDPLVFIGGSYGAWPTPVTVSAPLNEWHHYAATYNGKSYDIFIDGKRIDGYDRTVGGPIDQDDNPLAIGRDSRTCCNTRNMPVTIDEAMVWSRALTEAEIAEAMEGNLQAVSANGKLATCWADVKSH